MKIVRKQTDAGKNFSNALKVIERSDKVGKVGWFKGAKYPDGTPVAYVATIQEYGFPAKKIPPRPTMRPTIAKKQSEWRAIMEKLAKQILEGKQTVEGALDLVGQQAAGDIREAITQLVSPELKPATIQARLRKYKNKSVIGKLDKPLVETGKMLNTLTNAVEKE